MDLNKRNPKRCLVTAKGLTAADTGDWTCELDDVESQPKNLEVNPPLIVTSKPVQDPVREGENIELSCESNENVETCTFHDATGKALALTPNIDTNTCTATLTTHRI